MPGMSFRLDGSADAIGPVMDWIALHNAAWGEERGKRGWFTRTIHSLCASPLRNPPQ